MRRSQRDRLNPSQPPQQAAARQASGGRGGGGVPGKERCLARMASPMSCSSNEAAEDHRSDLHRGKGGGCEEERDNLAWYWGSDEGPSAAPSTPIMAPPMAAARQASQTAGPMRPPSPTSMRGVKRELRRSRNAPRMAVVCLKPSTVPMLPKMPHTASSSAPTTAVHCPKAAIHHLHFAGWRTVRMTSTRLPLQTT